MTCVIFGNTNSSIESMYLMKYSLKLSCDFSFGYFSLITAPTPIVSVLFSYLGIANNWAGPSEIQQLKSFVLTLGLKQRRAAPALANKKSFSSFYDI